LFLSRWIAAMLVICRTVRGSGCRYATLPRNNAPPPFADSRIRRLPCCHAARRASVLPPLPGFLMPYCYAHA